MENTISITKAREREIQTQSDKEQNKPGWRNFERTPSKYGPANDCIINYYCDNKGKPLDVVVIPVISGIYSRFDVADLRGDWSEFDRVYYGSGKEGKMTPDELHRLYSRYSVYDDARVNGDVELISAKRLMYFPEPGEDTGVEYSKGRRDPIGDTIKYIINEMRFADVAAEQTGTTVFSITNRGRYAGYEKWVETLLTEELTNEEFDEISDKIGKILLEIKKEKYAKKVEEAERAEDDMDFERELAIAKQMDADREKWRSIKRKLDGDVDELSAGATKVERLKRENEKLQKELNKAEDYINKMAEEVKQKFQADVKKSRDDFDAQVDSVLEQRERDGKAKKKPQNPIM